MAQTQAKIDQMMAQGGGGSSGGSGGTSHTPPSSVASAQALNDQLFKEKSA